MQEEADKAYSADDSINVEKKEVWVVLIVLQNVLILLYRISEFIPETFSLQN